MRLRELRSEHISLYTFLPALRELKAMTQADIAAHMCRRMPGKALGTYKARVGWLERSVVRFHEAIGGKEPDRTYLCLYVEALDLTPEEKAIFMLKVKPGTDMALDPELLEGAEMPLDARIELDIIPKLRQLPKPYLDQAELYIDTLARDANQNGPGTPR
jgi:hypothetical protein